jgi:hypothetical protein
MATFYENKSNPRWTALRDCPIYVLCVVVAIPLLEVILFIQEVPTIRFIVILASGMGGLLFLNEQVNKRSRIVMEVASKPLKQPSKTVAHTVLEFPEDAGRGWGRLLTPINVSLFLLGYVTLAYMTKGVWFAFGVALAELLLLPLLTVSWSSRTRLRIEGDQVQVLYPFLGGWGNRAFRFGEIAWVEVSVVNKVRKAVRIGLHDGSSIRYMNSNGAVVDELFETLRGGVPQAKPAPLDWSELA